MFKNITSNKGTQRKFKKDVEHLGILIVLEKSNNSEWGSPSSAQPKPKTNQERFIIDFINLNKGLKHKQ